MALQRGNAVAFRNTVITEWNAVASITHFSYSNIIMPDCGFVLLGYIKKKNIRILIIVIPLSTLTFSGNFLQDRSLDTPANIDLRMSSRPLPTIKDPTAPTKLIKQCIPPNIGTNLEERSVSCRTILTTTLYNRWLHVKKIVHSWPVRNQCAVHKPLLFSWRHVMFGWSDI